MTWKVAQGATGQAAITEKRNRTGGKMNVVAQSIVSDAPPAGRDMVWIPGGQFLMGSDHHYPEEAPAHRVKVDGFWIDRHTVTNREFAKFIAETGYVTVAERPANPDDYPDAKPEMLVPSSTVFRKPPGPVDMRNHLNWWFYVPGANWRHPRGPASSIAKLKDHPGRPRHLRRCRSLCALGRNGAADGGGI